MGAFRNWSEDWSCELSGTFEEAQFEDTMWSGAEKLLKVKIDDLLLASSKTDEEISDLFYFVEGNGTHMKSEDVLDLYEIDDAQIVLIDGEEGHMVAIRKNDKELFESIINTL